MTLRDNNENEVLGPLRSSIFPFEPHQFIPQAVIYNRPIYPATIALLTSTFQRSEKNKFYEFSSKR